MRHVSCVRLHHTHIRHDTYTSTHPTRWWHDSCTNVSCVWCRRTHTHAHIHMHTYTCTSAACMNDTTHAHLTGAPVLQGRPLKGTCILKYTCNDSHTRDMTHARMTLLIHTCTDAPVAGGRPLKGEVDSYTRCPSPKNVCAPVWGYGVASISRLLKIVGLFCKRALPKETIFCKRGLWF